jgi:hypothetical protein
MKVYACGGTGINIVRGLNLKPEQVAYIDTSKSNVKGVPEESLYLIKDMEGAGKFRATSFEGSVDEIPDILFKHKPGNVNILVASASGGSGSVLSALILKRLLSQSAVVIVALVASYDSVLETQNTFKALNTLAAASLECNKPVVCFYEENIATKTSNGRSESDNRIKALIAYIATILENSEELDMEDIKNFTNYTKVTGREPGLVYLDTLVDTNEIDQDTGTPISALSVIKSFNVNYTLTPKVPYQAVGIISNDTVTTDVIHLVITDGYFQGKISELDKSIKSVDAEVKPQKTIDVEKGKMYL